MATRQQGEEAIFNDARKIESPPKRAEFLKEVCGDDHRLKARVEALLGVHEQEPEFLQAPPSGLAPTIEQPAVAEGPGTAIGPYKLLQQIGEGGFGVVYMAEQERPVRRKVALKIIKPGMDTKEVIARFEVEEQALALMDHPNIAHVFDAGATESGRPYFVMELVKGIPITDYCDQYNLATQERLDLFASVCHAVQHAHQKGIIHRDIKPSNVLVTLHDGEPVVKVIDFGVAKAINQRLTERTLFTKFAQLVGTPLYMSPEQAELSGLDVDTRTDIYSLGVLLYELLTGTTPFDKQRIHEAAYDEIRRIIREEEPRKPSTQISTLGDTASKISAHRKTEPKKLSALLRGDLDWIVMKALEKDRTRRYATAKDFAADVMRYVNDEPVEASPPSVVYRFRKYVRRNSRAVAVATTAVILLVLIAGGAWRVTVVDQGRQMAILQAAKKELEAENANRKLEIAEKQRIIDQRAAEEATERAAQAEKQREEEARKAKDIEWLRSTALPELQKMKDDKKWSEAFALAEEARAKFPEDASVLQYWQEVSSTWSVVTNPPGAKASVRPYGDVDQPWTLLGTTPLNRVPVARDFYHWKIEKDGYELVEGCAGPNVVDLKVTLDAVGTLPAGMVRVAASMREGEAEFIMDRHEVTNKQFKSFVDAGGYTIHEYWQHRFVDEEGNELPFKEALARFVDSTGKPGPSTWKDGTYAAGEDDHPVRGVSWYEAAAYAFRVRKSLPTIL